ncbi:coil containing protein [Vibrio phage 1.164.O._10N.261.51.A7]|nr:coil containing protein [Vibrio phage 1.164.O._10N.261.51.A7]
MAYSPSEKYPGAVDVDPDYQGGKFRDNNPSTTNNGSPLKAIDRNELLARDEAIMNDAGFEYNGMPDTPQDSQLFKAYKASLGNGANLLSNHNFLIKTPDDSQPLPSATPTSYPPGHQIFSGVFANETTGITNLTYIDGRVSFSGGDLYFAVQNTGGIERLSDFVASVADFDGNPRTRGVSFALVGDEYRVTVGIDALEDESAVITPLGSVKFEQGIVATGHETTEPLIAQTAGRLTNYQAASVADMIAGKPLHENPITLALGQHWSTGGTSWILKDSTGPITINNFRAFNALNVLDFGAKGDNSTDDTDAIQAAIDTAESMIESASFTTAPAIFLPAGAYKSRDLKIPTAIRMVGSGRTQTTILLLTSGTSLLSQKYVDTAVFHFHLEKMSLLPDDPSVNNPSGQVIFDIRGFSRTKVEDVNIGWCGGVTGVSSNEMTYTQGANWYNSFYNVFCLRPASWPVGGVGWHIGTNDTAFQQSTTWSWFGGRTSGSGDGTGFDIAGASSMFFFGHTIEGATVQVGSNSGDRDTRSVCFHNTYFEGCDVFVNNSASWTSVVGGRQTTGTWTDTSTSSTYLTESQAKFNHINAGDFTINQYTSTYPEIISKVPSAPAALRLTNEDSGNTVSINGPTTNPASIGLRLQINNATSYEFGTFAFRTGDDGAKQLGQISRRWSEVFAVNGSINTSDATLKTDVRQLTSDEISAARALSNEIGAFKWLDRVEVKGDKAREHIGMTVQRAMEVMESFNLDPFNYGFICFDKWDDELDDLGNVEIKSGQRYSFRPDQLDRFIARGLRSEIDDIKERMDKAGI